jgi:hypothetical protein
MGCCRWHSATAPQGIQSFRLAKRSQSDPPMVIGECIGCEFRNSFGSSAPSPSGVARANRRHILPWPSVANKKTHTRSQNNLFCPHRSQHSRYCFKLPLKPPLLRFLSVCSVSSVVSHGFRLTTQLLNNRMRNLPGLKPTLRFLARGATHTRAKRGHVIPRHSAFFRGQKKDQREILCATADCIARGVHCDPRRAKLPTGGLYDY